MAIIRVSDVNAFRPSSVFTENYISKVVNLRFRQVGDSPIDKIMSVQESKENIAKGYNLQLKEAAKRIVNEASIKEFQNVLKQFYGPREGTAIYKSLSSVGNVKRAGMYSDIKNAQERKKIAYVVTELNNIIRTLARENMNANNRDVFAENVYRNISLVAPRKRANEKGRIKTAKEIFTNIIERGTQLANIEYTPSGQVIRGTLEKRTLSDFGYNISDMRLNNLFRAINKTRRSYEKTLGILRSMTDADILKAWSENQDAFDIVFDYKNDERLTDSNDEEITEILLRYKSNKVSIAKIAK